MDISIAVVPSVSDRAIVGEVFTIPRKDVECQSKSSENHESFVQTDIWDNFYDTWNTIQSRECQDPRIPE